MALDNTNRVTVGAETWVTQEHYVERLMDNAAFTAAHPDDTLLLAGPARFDNTDDFITKLLPIGQIMNMSVAGNAPVQPMTAIGSGRTFFLRGKGQISGSIGRLFMNGRNLLRVLYTSAVQAGIDVSKFDDPAADKGSSDKFFVNLDSELFYIPFGMAVLFRDKSRRSVGAFYVELMMLTQYSIGVASGQAMILEQVGFLGDRLKPVLASSFLPQPTNDDVPAFASFNNDVLGLGATENDFVPNLTGETGPIR